MDTYLSDFSVFSLNRKRFFVRDKDIVLMSVTLHRASLTALAMPLINSTWQYDLLKLHLKLVLAGR